MSRDLGGLLLLSVASIALLHAGSMPIVSNDLDIYVAMGRWMLENRALYEVDTFTWTAEGTPFLNGTWLWSLLAGALDPGLLRLLCGASVASAITLVGLARPREGAPLDLRAAGLAALYAWALLLQNTAMRGQTFVYPIFSALILLSSRGCSPLWALPLGALWGGLHGSFPAGVAFFLLRGQWRWALGLGLGACLGPYGPWIYAYIAQNSLLPADRAFAEWASPTLDSFEGARFYAALVLWAFFAPKGWRDRATFLAFALLALSGLRFVSWFGLATAPLLLRRLRLPEARPWSIAPVINGLGACFWGALLLRGLPREATFAAETPLAQARSLQGATRTFNPPEYGGLLSLTRPGLLTSGDVRTWIFDDEAWGFYLRLSDAPPGWEEDLERAGVDGMLLIPSFHADALLPAVKASPRWRLLVEDENGASFERVF